MDNVRYVRHEIKGNGKRKETVPFGKIVKDLKRVSEKKSF